MTYSETVAVIYRITSAYPSQARYIDKSMTEAMIREWHENLKSLPSDGVMEAVTELVSEQKWMPSLSEVISKILDKQYGTDDEIIRELDHRVSFSSNCIIFGEVTEDQERGFERLTYFQKMIIRSPYEFSMWMMKDYEWKAERVLRVKRQMQHGGHKTYLNETNPLSLGEGIFKRLGE